MIVNIAQVLLYTVKYDCEYCSSCFQPTISRLCNQIYCSKPVIRDITSILATKLIPAMFDVKMAAKFSYKIIE